MRIFSSLQGNPNYRYLWTGNLFSNAAQWLQLLTVGWLVLSISGGSALHSGTAVGIRALPTLVLGPWAGVLADRWDRRRIAVAVQVAMAILASLFALLVATDRIALWHTYSYMLLSGVGFAVLQPARQALIANTVPKRDMPNALALNAMAVTSMRLVGPIIGGVLIETVGFKWNFFAEAGMYVGMVLLLLPMQTPYREAGSAANLSVLSNLLEGLRYIWSDRIMMRLNLLNFTRTVVFQPLVLLLPVYTQEALNAGAGAGTALLTFMGIGGLATTVTIAAWGFSIRKGLVCLVTLLSGSACILLLGQSHWLVPSLLLMVIMGASQTYFIVSNQTLIQTTVPDALRGRVSSVWQYEQGLIPLAVLLLSLLANFTNISFTLSVIGALSLALGGFYLLRFGDIRALD